MKSKANNRLQIINWLTEDGPRNENGNKNKENKEKKHGWITSVKIEYSRLNKILDVVDNALRTMDLFQPKNNKRLCGSV